MAPSSALAGGGFDPSKAEPPQTLRRCASQIGEGVRGPQATGQSRPRPKRRGGRGGRRPFVDKGWTPSPYISPPGQAAPFSINCALCAPLASGVVGSRLEICSAAVAFVHAFRFDRRRRARDSTTGACALARVASAPQPHACHSSIHRSIDLLTGPPSHATTRAHTRPTSSTSGRSRPRPSPSSASVDPERTPGEVSESSE